jgi:hypothetical protein
VLALGYMIAYWGGMGVAQRRRLRLLRDVSRLSNPRFGVDQTIATMLIQTRDFYHASNCLLLMRDSGDELWQLHSSGAPDGRASLSRLPEGAAAPLLVFAPQALVQYAAPLHARLPGTRESRTRLPGDPRWQPLPPEPLEQLIDLLDASSFVSAPLPLRKGEGRIYVVSDRHRFNRADAVFLQQLAAQVFPVIENIRAAGPAGLGRRLPRAAEDCARPARHHHPALHRLAARDRGGAAICANRTPCRG